MSVLLSDDDLERARKDPEFRQELLAAHLDRLLEALKAMRKLKDHDPVQAEQIREGVQMAVKLAEKVQKTPKIGLPGRLSRLERNLAFCPEPPITPASVDPGWELNGRPSGS